MSHMYHNSPGLTFQTDAPPIMIGHAIANADIHLDTALNTAWRDTVVHFLFGRGWEDTASKEEVAEIREDVTNVKMKHLRSLAPESGAYFNEVSWSYALFRKRGC